MGYCRPAEWPAVMIVGPRRSRGPTIMTKGHSKGRQFPISPSQIMLLLLLLLPAPLTFQSIPYIIEKENLILKS